MNSSEKKKTRYEVHNALKAGTIANPLTPEQVSAQTGIHITLVRNHIANTLRAGLAHNTNPDRRYVAAYAWGPKPMPETLHRERHTPTGIYDGRDLLRVSTRPGAMDAYSLPSVVSGEAVERKRPALVSSNVVEGLRERR